MKIRTMTEADMGFALEMIRLEGWRGETEHVFRGFLELDPNGCSIAQEDGSPIGMCVAVSYGHCGFLGELIVFEEFRGHGFGRKLMQHSIDYLEKAGCRSICLDGDEPATTLYEKLGFVHVCKSLRFLGTITGRETPSVRPMARDDLEAIASIDREVFGADRFRYLERRFRLFPELCRTMVSCDGVSGYAMGQPGVGVISVGPWVVIESAASGLDLLRSLAVEVGDSPLRIGVLESNSIAGSLLRSVETLKETTPSFRMVLGQKTRVGMSTRIFGIGAAAKG
jgi:predicted N-acetyltransferase YhbS